MWYALFFRNFTLELEPTKGLFSREFKIIAVMGDNSEEEVFGFDKTHFYTGHVKGFTFPTPNYQKNLCFPLPNCPSISRPLIQLLHRINQYYVMKKEDPFHMNEMNLKFSKIVIFSYKNKILEIRKCYSMALMFTFDLNRVPWHIN